MRRTVLLLACMIGLPGAAVAQAQQAATQEEDVATLKKEVKELRQQLDQERQANEARMKALEQKFAELPAARAPAQEAPATQAAPLSAADELEAAIKGAQAEATPADSNKPAAGAFNWFQPPAPLQSFNPDISMVGDFQGHFDSQKDGVLSDKRILRELELGIGGNIDPYMRVDTVFSVHPKDLPETEGYDIEVEEAYVTPFSLPFGLQAKLGKFRVDFGKVNEFHQHALPWPDYPLVIQKFFGEEGLSGEGASVSWLVPGNRFIELTGQSFHKDTSNMLGGDDSDDFVHLLHLKTFADLDKESTLEWGFTGAVMPKDQNANGGTVAVEGTDLTFKWRPQKEGLYKSFKWMTEVMASQRDVNGQRVCALGMYSAPEYQFAQRWAVGLRYDFTQDPEDSARRVQAGSIYLTFMQSEFCYWRLDYQVSHSDFPGDPTGLDHKVFLQLDFTIGPHPAHKY